MIEVGTRKIGDGYPPFIVAEVGSNWRTREDCLNSVVLAAKCGADAVKFQALYHEALYGLPQPKRKFGTVALAPQVDHGDYICEPGQLPLGWIQHLRAKAAACGIEFMCSAFSPELVEAVDPYVNIHKVASAELTHVRILEKLKAIGKPVILSTGASGDEDIARALDVLGDTPTVLLYCIAAYPARHVEPMVMWCIGKDHDRMVGYSDHTTDVAVIPRAFVQAGARVLEKHVNFAGVDSPDAPHSLSTDEFRLMVCSLDPNYALCDDRTAEKPMIQRHNRRLIATRDLPAGSILQEGVNFGIYRSLKDDAHAFSPWLIDEVNGRMTKREIRAGDGVGPGDV